MAVCKIFTRVRREIEESVCRKRKETNVKIQMLLNTEQFLFAKLSRDSYENSSQICLVLLKLLNF